MLWITIASLVTILIGAAAWQYAVVPSLKKTTKTDNNAMFIIIAMAAAFLLRIILAAVYKGHETDMNCFIGWSDAIFEHGVREFYTLDMFHDYPPGYMYVLYIVGAVNKLFGFSGGMQYVVVKMPAIICDLAAAFVISRIAKRKFSDGVSTMLAALYLFNPAAILNCAIWGQVDSVYTLFALLMLYFITDKKMIQSYFMFAICLFIKPQAFIFTPVLIGGIIVNVFLEDYSREKLIKNLCFGLGAIAAIFLVALPFGIGNVIEQYRVTLNSYANLSVNAFNIWSAMGQNWGGLTPFANILSYLFLAAISVYSLYIIIKNKDESRYYYTGALLTFLTYMLSVRMHERYAFPAMILLLAAFVVTPEIKKYFMYVLVTASQIFNSAWALFFYTVDPNKYFRTAPVTVGSIINVLLMLAVIFFTHQMYVQNRGVKLVTAAEEAAAETVQSKGKAKGKAAQQTKGKTAPKTAKKVVAAVQNAPKAIAKSLKSDILPKLAKADIIAMAVITAVYTCVALYDLGDMHAAETEYWVQDGQVTVDLGRDYRVSKFMYYLGAKELNDTRVLTIKATTETGEETYSEDISSGAVFFWSDKTPNANMRYINISTQDNMEISIKEFAVFDADGNLITPVKVTPEGAAALFDEQDEVPERQSFRNSTYFDEIYHGRTGYEFVHSMSVYEWTHPPLGKVFIALGILLFGMCPFGWRIAGTVFGIIMVPIIYMFAKKLLKRTWLSVVTCLLFTFDFMHFAQTRIATIDVYVTFFIMLMYYFMYKYYRTSFYDTPFKKGLGMLALSGTAMGLGIASKWTGIYAGAGLAVIFLITLYRRYDEYRYAVKNPKGETDGISHKFIIDNFKPYTIKTLLWCVIFFAVVPVTIYCLAYIPYLKAPDQNGFASIFANQSSMLTYHSKTVLDAEHAFSSRWYEWIIMKRPIWYYSGRITDDIKEGISAFGNPLVWWMGVPAFFYMLYRVFTNKDKKALFLVIAYLAQLISWIPVTRLTFIYHYFPCVPFIVLMIGYSLCCIYEQAKNKKLTMYAIFGYTALVIVLFMMFYPVLSGQAVSVEYVKNYLKWFDSWVLI